MANPVTGPNAAKVYIQRPFRVRSPAMLWYTRPLPVSEDEPAGDDLFWQLGGTRAKTVQGKRAVRRAVDLWNEKADRDVFELTERRSNADVVVKEGGPHTDRSHGYPAGNWPGQTFDKELGAAVIAPEDVGDASTIAHELGHTQGLQHLQLNPKPGIMRYGTPAMMAKGGGAHRKQPTETEGQKVVHYQNKGADRHGWDPASPAEQSAATFNKAAKKKKPAHERKVTGGHKVMQ